MDRSARPAARRRAPRASPAVHVDVRELGSLWDSTSMRRRGVAPSNEAENSNGVPSSEMSFGQMGASPTAHSAQDPLMDANTSSAWAVSASDRFNAAASARSFLAPSAPSVTLDN